MTTREHGNESETKMKATELKIGDRVEAGKNGTEDYDCGRVDIINDDGVTVSWDSLIVTTQPESLLIKI